MTGLHTFGGSIVLQQVPQPLQPLVQGLLAAIPLIIGAIVILLLGLIIGLILGGVVKRIVRELSPSQYAEGTPLEREGDADSDIAQAFGDLTKYIIYLLALLVALDFVGIAIPGEFLTGIAGGAVQVIIAGVILVAGVAIGRFVGDLVGNIVSGFGLDSFVRGTPLADATDAVGGTGNAIGRIVEFLIYYFALVAAVDALQFPALSEPLSAFIGQIPLLIAGLVVLVVGIYVADLLGDIVGGVDVSRATDYAGLAVQLFVYYLVLVFALDTAGFDTEVLTNLFNAAIAAFFGALGLGLAIAIGIGVGWGSKDYIAANIDDWMGSARSSASDLAEEDETAGSSGSAGSTRDAGSTGRNEDMFDDGPGDAGPGGTGGSGPTDD